VRMRTSRDPISVKILDATLPNASEFSHPSISICACSEDSHESLLTSHSRRISFTLQYKRGGTQMPIGGNMGDIGALR
jgi:hypothetical protein